MADFKYVRSILTSKIGTAPGKATLSIQIEGNTEVLTILLFSDSLTESWIKLIIIYYYLLTSM